MRRIVWRRSPPSAAAWRRSTSRWTPGAYTTEQFAGFLAVRDRLLAEGIGPLLLHAASTGAVLFAPETQLDMVRIGIALSGHSSSPARPAPVVLCPALTIRARIVRLFHLPPGASVGYGRLYHAPDERTIATVPIGYADGYFRALTNRGVALVAGRRCPVVGRISMDQLTLDVTGVPGVREGDPVVLLGRQGAAEVTADELAAAAGTISYELMARLAPRLPRLYLRAGAVVEVRTLLGGLTPGAALPVEEDPPLEIVRPV